MKDKERRFELSEFRSPIIILIIFWTVAIVFWQTKDKVFYLFNFGYIGTSVAIGLTVYTLLPRKKKPAGRRFAQFLVGLYMLGFLGLIRHENMQIEGFFSYLLSGFFSGAVIHYVVAKIVGPVIFGRGWCAWACWTAMILDLLPHTKNKVGRVSAKWEKLRLVHFGISLALILGLWFGAGYRAELKSSSELWWLIIGNIFYFASGIILAYGLKDNRAFCKYLCPITIILKVTSRFSLLKIGGDKEKCNDCRVCAKACPMDINIPEYIKNGKRVLSTECIFCLTCTTVCPEKILDSTTKFDLGGEELIRRRNNPGS